MHNERTHAGAADHAVARADGACCAPTRHGGAGAKPSAIGATSSSGSTDTMVLVPGGSFIMGSEDADCVPADGEGPLREVHIDPFWVDATAVSNAQFAAFVDDSGYVTDAERFGSSFVFDLLLGDDHPPTPAVAGATWWRQVRGACWRAPEGSASEIGHRLDHPVVHVSWHDAAAYALWSAKRLLTEAEWEHAARGGFEQRRFPWGDELEPGGEHRCNVWQGSFPAVNTLGDGYLGTSPVHAFPPNAYGLYDMCGNVWEWCADRWSSTFHRTGPRTNPRGPACGGERVMRGGSYLCHASYCNRYRVSGRNRNTPESSTGNTGFRCARQT